MSAFLCKWLLDNVSSPLKDILQSFPPKSFFSQSPLVHGEIVSISIMEVLFICFVVAGLSFAKDEVGHTNKTHHHWHFPCLTLSSFPCTTSAFAATSLKIEYFAFETEPPWQPDKWRQRHVWRQFFQKLLKLITYNLHIDKPFLPRMNPWHIKQNCIFHCGRSFFFLFPKAVLYCKNLAFSQQEYC